MKNIDLIHELIIIADSLLDRPKGTSKELINYVSDRPGHDFRYAIDSRKILKKLSRGILKSIVKKAVSSFNN